VLVERRHIAFLSTSVLVIVLWPTGSLNENSGAGIDPSRQQLTFAVVVAFSILVFTLPCREGRCQGSTT
jgi:hypothetical protein